MKNVLDAPPAELALALENESGLPENLRGKCSAPLRGFSEPQLAELLHAAAKVRFQNKAGAMLARAKNSGWEQALWENLFRALGYKHNVWPMQNLAETKPRWMRGAESAFEIQARLLGVSGLLPDELTRAQKSSGHVSAPRVGFLVARPRRICKLHLAARQSGNSTACARPTTHSAGSRWRRTGWRRKSL